MRWRCAEWSTGAPLIIANSWKHTKLMISPGSDVTVSTDIIREGEITLLEDDVTRVVDNVNERMSIGNFLNHPSEELTIEAFRDEDLAALALDDDNGHVSGQSTDN